MADAQPNGRQEHEARAPPSILAAPRQRQPPRQLPAQASARGALALLPPLTAHPVCWPAAAAGLGQRPQLQAADDDWAR